MRKEFEHLALLAGGSHYPTVNPKMQEAFARMIIDKCAEIADHDPIDRSAGCGYITKTAGQRIKEYFGIEDGRQTGN
jgi:hypothetical protein